MQVGDTRRNRLRAKLLPVLSCVAEHSASRWQDVRTEGPFIPSLRMGHRSTLCPWGCRQVPDAGRRFTPALLLVVGMSLTLLAACDKKMPVEPPRDNVLDVHNPVTGGDPFGLAVEVAAAGVRLNWTPVRVSGVVGYVVYRQVDGGSFVVFQDVEGQHAGSLLDREVTAGRRYTYYVVARLANGGQSPRHPGQASYTLSNDWVGNLAPVADAGPDQTVRSGTRVTLDGSGSRDPEGDALTYRWTAPSGITLSSTTAVQPTFTATTPGTFRFTLVVNDGFGDSRAAEVVVVVTLVEMVRLIGGTLPDIGHGELNVASFDIGRYEVTWAQWQEVRAWAMRNGYDLGGVGAGCREDHPVHTVNWYDVVKWSNALSEMERRTPVYRAGGAVYRRGEEDNVSVNASADGYRLPTGAEWEYAARGGRQSRGFVYSGSNSIDAVAWFGINSGGAACSLYQGHGTWPVGQKQANELGLYDMSGNVWEWCFDWHPDWAGPLRLARGGSWTDDAIYCQVGYGYLDYPASRYINFGFRLAANTGR